MTPEKKRRLRRKLRRRRMKRERAIKALRRGISGGKVRRRTQGMNPRRRFARLVKRYIQAQRAGKGRLAKKTARRIMRMASKQPRLKKTRAYKAFIRTRGYTIRKGSPQSLSAIPRQYSPGTGQSAAASAEGEVIDAPEDFEDLPDEDEDYNMDGYGAFFGAGARGDKLTYGLVAAGLVAFGFSFGKGTKKQKKHLKTAGAALAGAGFLRHFMQQKNAQTVAEVAAGHFGELEIMDGFGELEIMDGFGELEIMDGFGDFDELSTHDFGYPGNMAALGSYGELEIMDGF